MTTRSLTLALLLACAPAALAQKGTYRLEFQSTFGSGGIDRSGPSHSQSKVGGRGVISSTLQADRTIQLAGFGAGGGFQTAKLAGSMNLSVRASGIWMAPSGSDPKVIEEFEASLKIKVTDIAGTVLCDASETKRVPEGQPGAFSAVPTSCAPSNLALSGAFSGASADLYVDYSLTSPLGDHVEDRYSVTYHVYTNWDEIELSGLKPSPCQPNGDTQPCIDFATGVQQSFSALVTAGLGTRPDAEMRLLLVDAGFNPLAASQPVPRARADSGQFCCGQTMSVGPVALPQQETSVFLLALLTAPGGEDVLASQVVAYRVQNSGLSGRIGRSGGGVDYWLPGVPVELYEVTATGETKIGTTRSVLRGTQAHPFADYHFEPADLTAPLKPNGTYRLRARLEDGAGDVLEPRYIRVGTIQGGSYPEVVLEWQPFTSNTSSNRHHDLVASRGAGLANQDPESAELGVEAYWYSFRQVYLMAPTFMPAGFQMRLSLPVEVLIDPGDDAATSYCFEGSGGDCPLRTSIVVDLGSSADEIYQAWGQHFLHELWGGTVDPGPTHARKDSIRDGFERVWALRSAQLLDARSGTRLRFGGLRSEPLELNEGFSSNYLWDLLDVHVDREPRSVEGRVVLAQDEISMALGDLVAQIGTPISDPGVPFVRPRNVEELAQRLAVSFPLFNAPSGNGLSFLRNELELFAAPSVPARRPAASSPDPIGGSFIAVSLVDSDNNQVSASRLDIEYVFGPPYETLNEKDTLLVQAGNVYFEMPPARYPVQAFLSIPGSSERPLRIDNAAYWAAVPTTSDHFLAHTFVVPSDVPQVDYLYPQYAAAGTRTTLTGRNFGADAVVTFGVQRAAVVSASAGALVVTVPSLAAGTFEVTVTRAGGISNSVSFDVLAPALFSTPGSLEFGTVAQGASAQKAVTIRNGGEADLVITSAAVTPAAGPFTVLPPATRASPITVAPGAEQVFTVRFAPSDAPPAEGELVIATNDLTHRTASVPLSGRGGPASGPRIATSPGAISFGSVAVGQNRTATLTVRNIGGAALSVSSATFGATAFTLVSTPALPLSLAPGAEQALTVKFTPTAAGSQASALVLGGNAPALAIGLSGEGAASGTTPPACTYGVSPATLLLPPGATSGTIAVTAAAGCAWSASSTAGFVTVGPAGGSGNGSVTYQVSANDSTSDRTARLTIAGLPVGVTQETEGSATTTVPIVLSTKGVGTAFFTSELTLTNRGQTDAIAEMTYTAAFGGGSGTASDVVPAGTQLIFPDALEYLRSLGIPIPATGNRGGTLRVKFLNVTAASSGSATVRTASVVPEGRAGLAYGAVTRGSALTGTAFLCGLRQNATDRTNVAVINAGKPDEGDVVLRLTVFSGDPSNPISKVFPDVGLAPGGFAQFSGILGLEGLSLSNGWVKVERVGGTAPYFAYAVINDQANSDGSFVPPVLAQSLAGKTGETLPVIVEVSTFSSELVVTNFGSATKTFKVTFVADAIQATGNAASLDFTLAAGEQRILPDFVQVLRDQHVAGIGPKGPTFAGAAFVTVSSGDVSGLFIGARTSSPGGGGRYGLFYTGVPNGSAAGASPVFLYGLQQNADNRANVAFVNTGETDGSTDTLQVQIYDGTKGSLVGTFEVTLGPKRWSQTSGVLSQYGVANAYALVSRKSGSNPFVAYAVVNDGGAPGQRSGDGAFVTMDASQ